MAEELKRDTPEWMEEWQRLQPLLEEWKHEHNPMLSEVVMQSLKRLGLVLPQASPESMVAAAREMIDTKSDVAKPAPK
jgi:hypothetical protein